MTSNNNFPAEPVKGPVFVVGMWRSGTSLLYALLNQHPQIALMFEGDLPLLAPLFRNGKSRPDWLERWEFWNGALSRHQMEARSINNREVSSLREAMELIYRQYAGLAIWGCKSPNYFDCMVPLAEEFPAARFIVIYRNPLDICRSVVRAGRKSPWFAKRGMPLRALLGYHEMKKEADRLVLLGAHVHQLQYEDLVRDPNHVLGDICSFLQIPFDPRMVSLKDADRSAIYDADHHAGVKGKRIAAPGKRQEVLPAPLVGKIKRYVNLWRAEYGGTWPAHSCAESFEGDQPKLLERVADRFRYRALRSFDRAVAFIYCCAPMGVLRAYRGLTPRRLDLPQAGDSLQSASGD